MEMSILAKGIIIGIVVSAPLGAVGLLCIQRFLNEGRLFGFVSGMGATTADVFYGAIAVLGFSFISDVLLEYSVLLRSAAGIFLIYLGIRIFYAPPSKNPKEEKKDGLLSAYTSSFFLVITNPTAILAFMVIFAAIGGNKIDGSLSSALLLILGVFIGSISWWISIVVGTGLLRHRFDAARLTLVNRLSGAGISLFGVFVIASLVMNIPVIA